jgi:hypothetical protein
MPSTSVPVYDEQGELFAPSIAEAARRFGLSKTASLRDNHLIHYRDGYQLKSRPDPRNVGKRGGPRLRPRPVLGPQGERWESSNEAAAVLGCTVETVRRIGQKRGEVLYLACYPGPRGAPRKEESYATR